MRLPHNGRAGPKHVGSTLQTVRGCLPAAAYYNWFLGVLENLRKRLSFVMFVRLSAWNNSVPAGSIFMKFDVWLFFFKSIVKIRISLKSDKNKGYFTWRLRTCVIVSRWILLRMRYVSDKRCKEHQNTHFMFNIFFFENYAIYEIMWWNLVDSYGHGRQYNTALALCMPDD